MFNIHQYEKRLQDSQKIESQKKGYIKDLVKKKKLNEQMAKQYKKRIENFIVDSLDNPIKITDYKEKINVFRQEKPEKFLGDPQIYVTGFKNEQERIRLNQQKLNNLSIEPKINISNYNFRERQTDKEIQPEMRFQSYKTSLNKLQDYIKNNNMNEVENMNYQEEKQHKKLESSIVDQNQSFKSNNLTKRQQNYAYYAQSIAKTLMPTLHQKTHFKALQDICNQSPGSLSDKPKKKQYLSQDMKNQNNYNDNNNDNNNNTGVQDILSSLQDRKQSVGQGVQALLGTELKKQSSQIISAQGSDQLSNFGGRDSIIEQQKLNKKNSKINAGLETFDGPSFSKKILQRSHFIRPQNDKIPILLKGHGKSMFSKGLSNSQVYDQWSSKGNSFFRNNNSSILSRIDNNSIINNSNTKNRQGSQMDSSIKVNSKNQYVQQQLLDDPENTYFDII